MIRINRSAVRLDPGLGNLQSQQVFQLFAGTSTGGLIALMLVKMGMTVDECIDQYEKLSKDIFGHKHFRGRLTGGMGPAKYKGKRLDGCIRKTLRERHLDENLLMRSEDSSLAW